MSREPQIDIVTFLKACKRASDNKMTLEDCGKLMGRSGDYVANRLSNIKRERPELATAIDSLTIERAPAGRRKIEQRELLDILMGTIG